MELGAKESGEERLLAVSVPFLPTGGGGVTTGTGGVGLSLLLRVPDLNSFDGYEVVSRAIGDAVGVGVVFELIREREEG